MGVESSATQANAATHHGREAHQATASELGVRDEIKMSVSTRKCRTVSASSKAP